MSSSEIDAPTLDGLLRRDSPPVLVDILPEGAHRELRIPGSANACIYEVTFLSRMEEIAPDRERTVALYGSAPGSLDATDAADRLLRAGWRDVLTLRGGRRAWLDAGLPVEGDRASEGWTPDRPEPLPDGEFELDLESSVIDWTGRNLGGRHFGTIRFSEGTLSMEDGMVRRLLLVADLRTIEVGDLTGNLAKLLADHLLAEDFLAAQRFPCARFHLDSFEPLSDATRGRPGYRASGTLAIRDREQPVTFPVQAGPGKAEGVTLQACLKIDRTDFGMNYGSGKLYHRLGMHLVNDEVDLAVRLHTRRVTT